MGVVDVTPLIIYLAYSLTLSDVSRHKHYYQKEIKLPEGDAREVSRSVSHQHTSRLWQDSGEENMIVEVGQKKGWSEKEKTSRIYVKNSLYCGKVLVLDSVDEVQ